MRLKSTYTGVSLENGSRSFGGNQNWFDGPVKKCGCGLIASVDMMAYISGCDTLVDYDDYHKLILRMKKFFPMVPGRGLPVFGLSAELGGYMRRRFPEYRVRCGHNPFLIRSRVLEMLKNDTPVIFAVGFGIFRSPKNRGLKLYEPDGSGGYRAVKRVRNHFMVITGVTENGNGEGRGAENSEVKRRGGKNLETKKRGAESGVTKKRGAGTAAGDMAEVSSWGKKYYISLKELENYSLSDGFGLFTNIICLEKKKS